MSNDRRASPLVEIAEIGAGSHLTHLALDLLDSRGESRIVAEAGEQRIAAQEDRVFPSGADTSLERVERLRAFVLHQEQHRVLHGRVEADVAGRDPVTVRGQGGLDKRWAPGTIAILQVEEC